MKIRSIRIIILPLFLMLVFTLALSSCGNKTGDKNTGITSDSGDGTAEWVKFTSEESGREVWQMTTDSAGSVACYFDRQAITYDDKYLVFSSNREGKWRLFRTDMENGNIIPLSPKGRNIDEDDYTIHPDGEHVCYMDGDILYGLNVAGTEEKVLFDFSGRLPGELRFSGSFTNDGIYTLVSMFQDNISQLFRVNLKSGEMLLVHQQDAGRFSHPLMNPTDPEVMTYDPLPDSQNDMDLPMEKRARTWKINLRDGTDQPYLICPYGFRATHESWSADGKRLFFYRKTQPGWKPATICSINKEGDDLQEHLASDTIRLGHGIASPDGKWFVSDGQDKGWNPIILLNLETGSNDFLHWPNASISSRSEYSHVHPFFSTSGKFICYTSDVSGIHQVYVMPVDDLIHPNN